MAQLIVTHKKLNQLLSVLAMSDFMHLRIGSHASLYHDDIAPFQSSQSDDTLFVCCYFVLLNHLQAGNTLFAIKEDKSGKAWQMSVLAPMGQVFCLAVADYDYPALLADFAYAIQAGSEPTKLFVKTAQDKLITQSRQAGVDQYHAQKLGELLYQTLRFYYLTYVRYTNIAQFYQALLDNPFFIAYWQHLDKQGYLTYQEKKSPIVLSRFYANQKQQGFGLWLYRTWQAEFDLAWHILRLIAPDDTSVPVYDLEALSGLNQAQHQAVVHALGHHFSIITGGPGTGKTFTVAKLVMLLMQSDTPPKLALTAPTGKAAQRMQESLQQALQGANIHITLPKAKTLHRLLGIGADGVAYYHQNNPLSEEVIIVDEASMLGVALSCQLCAAIKTGAKLILLGDVYQLAAVEAGAVLRDLCQVNLLSSYHSQLTESRRFDENSGVGRLAAFVNQAQPSPTLMTDFKQMVQAYPSIDYHPLPKTVGDDIYLSILAEFSAYFLACFELLAALQTQSMTIDKQQTLFGVLNRYRILTASHLGQVGDEILNHQAMLAHLAVYHEQNTQKKNTGARPLFIKKSKGWYHGRAVMMTKNSYDLGLFNGDMGICVQVGGELLVFFEGQVMGIAVAMLKEDMIVSAYAMTIHKSQGSEFEQVAICFDEHNVQLLGRELLYTAITRAKQSVALYSNDIALTRAMTTPTVRHTGLKLTFDDLQKVLKQGT